VDFAADIRLSDANAIEAGEELVALLDAQLPYRPVAADKDPMQLIGPALLTRAAGTVQAIARLAGLRRQADAGVLLRVLLEHVVMFAWLSAGPGNERFLLWFKNDTHRRLTMHRDAPVGIDILPPAMKALFEGVMSRVDGKLPDTRTCAREADEYWTSRLPGVMSPENSWGSFLGLYQIVFRYMSSFTHPNLMGLSAVIRRTPEGEVVDMETSDGARSAVAMGTLTFGLGLYVSSVGQGWPSRGSLNDVFDRMRERSAVPPTGA
jgi:hypothetical protein